MPRNVRNFWLEIWVDGRKTRVALGPKAKEGGFHFNLFIRNEGKVSPAVHGTAWAGEKNLHLVIRSVANYALANDASQKIVIEVPR